MKTSTEQLVYNLKKNPASEPALGTGGIVTGVIGLLTIANQLLPNLLTNNQTMAITAIAAIAAPIITAILARRQVWSPASVLEVLEEAINEGQAKIKELESPTITKEDIASPRFHLPPDIDGV